MHNKDKQSRRNKTTGIAIIGSFVIALIMVLGTIWVIQSAHEDNERAAQSVSVLYLDELAGRREQVVENNLQNKIRDLRVAVSLMTEEDLSDVEHLQAYQARMKSLYTLDKFAFVDEDGIIYTSLGTQTNIDEYDIDYRGLEEPEISIFNLNTREKKVVIAVPVDLQFIGRRLSVCFMEIDMKEMLSGVSMESGDDNTTFCNIYTQGGVSLTENVLGSSAPDENLLNVMENVVFDEGYTYDKFYEEFGKGERGVVSFTYNGVNETLCYVPVGSTDWNLTYLVRESVISDNISQISTGMIIRGVIQSVITIVAMGVMFLLILSETRRSTKLRIETETAKAEVRGKQEELDKSAMLQKQLEHQSEVLSDALNAAEGASKAKSAFLSNMSHEIRTPMNAIIGLDAIALNDPETPEKTKEYLRRIGDSAEHLLGLINDILDMSRIESGRMVVKNEEFSFSKLLETINTIISGQCLEKGIEYNCHISPDLDDCYVGDNMKIRQILINILGNAVKFTPSGGIVSLDVIKKAEFEGKTTLQFTISDNGIGIREDFLPSIFEPFAQEDNSATNKYGSSGLGLAITKNIVDMMNGDIEVKSTKGSGSTFIVTLTLDNAKGDVDRIDHDVDPEDIKVLIVDDDTVACEHAKLVLRKAGISSEYVTSGAEAIEAVRLRHARQEPYNLILVDWQMPDMDGIETTRRIREITGKESAIIILTAYKWDDIFDEATSAGVDSFLSKPLFASSVLDEFRSALNKRRDDPSGGAAPVELRGCRVLLAEDVPINAEIMNMILSSEGIEVDLAENGVQAVELFEKNEPGYYDAILMDMRMPEMDGLEATRIIRASGRADALSIPVIALTANAFDEDVQRSLQAGLNAHLSKPIQPDVLFKTLKNHIRKKE